MGDSGASVTNIMVVDIDVMKQGTPSSGGAPYLFGQGCEGPSVWNFFDYSVETQLSVILLEHTQAADSTQPLQYMFSANRGAGVSVSSSLLGQGWQRLAAQKKGFGGCEQSWFHGKGHMRFAMLLPFTSFGDHGENCQVWRGWNGDSQNHDYAASALR